MKDRETEKVNTQAALQAHIRVNKTSKSNQEIEKINNATEYENNVDEILLFSSPPAKHKHSVQMKTSSRHKTVCTELLLGDPLPGSHGTMELKSQDQD